MNLAMKKPLRPHVFHHTTHGIGSVQLPNILKGCKSASGGGLMLGMYMWQLANSSMWMTKQEWLSHSVTLSQVPPSREGNM